MDSLQRRKIRSPSKLKTAKTCFGSATSLLELDSGSRHHQLPLSAFAAPSSCSENFLTIQTNVGREKIVENQESRPLKTALNLCERPTDANSNVDVLLNDLRKSSPSSSLNRLSRKNDERLPVIDCCRLKNELREECTNHTTPSTSGRHNREDNIRCSSGTSSASTEISPTSRKLPALSPNRRVVATRPSRTAAAATESGKQVVEVSSGGSWCVPTFCFWSKLKTKTKDTNSTRVAVPRRRAHSHPPPAASTSVDEEGKSTIAMGILMTSGLIWAPPCAPHRSRTNSELLDGPLIFAMQCPRWHIRRNALCDHMRLLMPQMTRESLQKEVASRKASVTRKVSQYFMAMSTCVDYEVDLF